MNQLVSILNTVEVPKSPPKKRSRKPKNAVASQVEPRTAVVKGRGNVGKLSVLPNMSLDILYEVRTFLHVESDTFLISICLRS